MTQKMLYKVYNNECELIGEFVSIYDMEHFMDDVRNSRGERYKELPRLCNTLVRSLFVLALSFNASNNLEDSL